MMLRSFRPADLPRISAGLAKALRPTLPVLACALLLGCGGVSDVENSSQCGPELAQITALGDEGLHAEDLVFGYIADLTVDAAGHLLVADNKIRSLRRLTAEGQILWDLNEEGQGPGAVRSPWLVDSKGEEVFLFDIGKRRVMVLDVDGAAKREILIPYFLYGMTLGDDGGIRASGVVDAEFEITEQQVIHDFDADGELRASFALERPFHSQRASSLVSRQIVHQYYAGRVAIERAGDHWLVSPVFDRASYLMTASGEVVARFENSRFEEPLLGYEVDQQGATFVTYESQSGPALQLPGGSVLKGYQIAEGESLRFTYDLFDADGSLVAQQCPLPGLPKAVGPDGRLFAVDNLPYPRIFVLDAGHLSASQQLADATGRLPGAVR